VAFLKERKVNLSILQCTTAYPTEPEQYGLNLIQELKNRYNVPVGFSDHSAKTSTCIAATALGASILEFHVVFDRQFFGPDSTSSLTISETKDLVLAVRDIAVAVSHPINKENTIAFSSLKQMFEKSLAVNKSLPQNHILTFNDLEAKKPKGYGLDVRRFQDVIGKTLNKDLKQWDFLNEQDFL
jgi:N-acetylneuraminate synthase